MELAQTEDEKEFRARARDWLRSNVPEKPRPTQTGPASKVYDTTWQRKQYDAGWAGVSWPKESGGLGLSLTHQMIWHEEYVRAKAPPPGAMFMALNHAGPTLIVRGNEAQKQRYLPSILKGEEVWCQGFSEPGAGSDLAGLQTRAVIDRDHLVVNGSKIWTSIAHIADQQELLVRTDPSLGRHGGMSWVVCDMKLPGITVRPIRAIYDDHSLNQVFYDNVRIPLENVVGGINNGWSVAMSTLSIERGVAMIPHQMDVAMKLEAIIESAKTRIGPDGVRKAIEHEDIAAKLAYLRAEVAANRAMTYMAVSRGLRQSTPGPEGAINALHYGELTQRIKAIALEILGTDYLDYGGELYSWGRQYLDSFQHTISGGTAEIRRGIIAERVLGLPRAIVR